MGSIKINDVKLIQKHRFSLLRQYYKLKTQNMSEENKRFQAKNKKLSKQHPFPSSSGSSSGRIPTLCLQECICTTTFTRLETITKFQVKEILNKEKIDK